MATNSKEKKNGTTNHLSAADREILKLIKQSGMIQDKEITTVTEFSKETNKIILPEGMSKLDAAKELEKQYEEEETLYDAIKEFPAWHSNDVLVAVKKATERTFGWMHGVTQWTFFGPNRPKEIEVQIDLKNGEPSYTQCFFGNFVVTPWDEAEGNVYVNGAGVCGVKLEVKKKFRAKINEYFREIENILKKESIYKGKCLKYEGGNFHFIEPSVNPHVVLNAKALRRPGRIDLIVRFEFSEPEAVKKIYRKKFDGLNGVEELDYEHLAEITPHVQGAVIAAIADRAVDYANNTGNGTITNRIVEASIASMEYQIEFMKEDPENTETREQKIVNNLADVISEKTAEKFDF